MLKGSTENRRIFDSGDKVELMIGLGITERRHDRSSTKVSNSEQKTMEYSTL